MERPKEHELLEIIKLVNQHDGETPFELEKIKPYLNEHMRVRVIPKDGFITREHEVVKHVYFIMSGEFFMMRLSESGKNNVLSRKVAPQFLGIDRILNAQMPSSASNMAISKCIVLEIELEHFIDSIRKNGDLGLLIIKNICVKLSQASYRADRLLFKDSRSRLMFYICEHWDRHHKGNGLCMVEVSNTFIADDIGISTRTLYRALEDLKADNLLTTKNGNIAVTYEQVTEMRKRCSEDLNQVER